MTPCLPRLLAAIFEPAIIAADADATLPADPRTCGSCPLRLPELPPPARVARRPASRYAARALAVLASASGGAGAAMMLSAEPAVLGYLTVASALAAAWSTD